MSRNAKQAEMPMIDVNAYDCGELPLYVERSVSNEQMPTEDSLAYMFTYTAMQLSVYHARLHRAYPGVSRVVDKWKDCLAYAFITLMVSEKAAEYNCPKSRWQQGMNNARI